jgi:hypothetical protein
LKKSYPILFYSQMHAVFLQFGTLRLGLELGVPQREALCLLRLFAPEPPTKGATVMLRRYANPRSQITRVKLYFRFACY